MRYIISYPLPFDNWNPYWRSVQRFTETLKKFPPGCDYEVWAVCNWGEPNDEVREWFYGIKTRFIPYYDSGCDLGGHQMVASKLSQDGSAFGIPSKSDLVVSMTSRCYFYRAGWLERIVQAYGEKGGLIGCSASKQGGTLHLGTRAFTMTTGDWNAYPHRILSRQDGPLFEVGTNNQFGSLLNWYSEHRGTVSVVHWDDVFELPAEWDRYLAAKNRFRDGNQEQMLVHDFHSQSYAEAGPEEKLKLEAMLRGENA